MSLPCAIWLGAVAPTSIAENRAMRDGAYLMIRDRYAGHVLFWPIAPGLLAELRSS